MRYLGKHGVGEILHHQPHVVFKRPAGTEKCPGLGLAGFEGDPGPSELVTQTNDTPIVGAFVQVERLALRHGMHVDLIGLEVVREGLFNVGQQPIGLGGCGLPLIEDRVDVIGIFYRAIEVGGKGYDVVA